MLPPKASDAPENVAISSANLKLDPPTLEKIRNAAQAIASQTSETGRADAERPGAEKAEAGDRRVQTLLTLKGFAEAVTAIPAKAAELLAGVVAEAAAPLPDSPDATGAGDLAALSAPMEAFDGIVEETERQHEPAAVDEFLTEASAEQVAAHDIAPELQSETEMLTDDAGEQRVDTGTGEDLQNVIADRPPLARPDPAQHAVPFAYAQVQPAREEMVEAAAEEETREDEERGEDDDDEESERRRPRDEYDEIHDPAPEEEPDIVINRDSSQADRAFALYQRMGGF
jgi:hypothetical protein